MSGLFYYEYICLFDLYLFSGGGGGIFFFLGGGGGQKSKYVWDKKIFKIFLSPINMTFYGHNNDVGYFIRSGYRKKISVWGMLKFRVFFEGTADIFVGKQVDHRSKLMWKINESTTHPHGPILNFGLVARKPVIGVSDKARFKPVSSATEISWKIESSPVAS